MARLYLSGRKEEELVKLALATIAKSPYVSNEDRRRAYAIHQRLTACQDLQGYKSKKNRQ